MNNPLTKKEPNNTPYGIIESNLRTKEIVSRMTLALGLDPADEGGKNEAFKYISSVLMEIQKTIGDEKKDLSVCTPDSIIQAMIDAANFRLPIDGRGLAYLIKYKDRAQFQVGYKGFIFKISEQYQNVDFTSEPVFEGDHFSVSDNNGYQTYIHEKSNPFSRDTKKLNGFFACLSYDNNGHRHSKVAALPVAEIEQIRKSAKQDFIWKEWFFEKAKVAAIKRLCKIHMVTALSTQQLIQYDNENEYRMEAPTDITPAKSAEKLTRLLEAKESENE